MTRVLIDSIKVRFGDFEALHNVSLNIESGSFVTLLGPSGCGKTTLLKTIAGFTSPTSGSIVIGDKEVHNLPPEKRDTAMCFQSYALFPHLSIANNLLFGPKQKNLPKDEQKVLLNEVAEQVSLTSQLDKLPTELSGGQQQRVALGRALAIQPGVILFDEPLSNLDAKLRDSVRFEIRQLQKKQNFTAIYVTHDQAEALAMSDLVVVMNQGAIQQIGSPQEIYHNPVNRFVADFIGAANILAATVLEQTTTGYRVQTELGELLVESKGKPVAKQTYVFWRPEDMTFDTQDINNVELKVIAKTFLGNLTEFLLSPTTSHQLNIRIQCLGFQQLQEKEQASCHIPANKIRFLAEES
ncbi:ABC transporter ATP-binding protein [Marinomonas sp. CT5]|uniref:ABC transporter ATP-binding protein n=1 Tax=Marinomonas sp. CT5 TaxID=2066133 RepID=UPI001BB0A9DA|nr:ABC transporter ATP-binding protein [Marinomonas sp. CT5]QUX97535.1 ABC transporter ATP-binding protein [Marinomonas sp. CT5]